MYIIINVTFRVLTFYSFFLLLFIGFPLKFKTLLGQSSSIQYVKVNPFITSKFIPSVRQSSYLQYTSKVHPFSTLKFNALVCQNQNFGMSKFNPSVRQSSTSLYVKVHLFSSSKLNPLVCQSATPQNVKRSTLQYVKVQHHRSSKFKTCTTECQSTTLQNVKR